MIANWLKRKIQIKSVQAAREDLERFVQSLRGATDEQIGLVVAIATCIRLRLTAAGSLPPQALELPTLCDGTGFVQLKIANLVRQFQKMDQLSDAAGAMVWLHTMRALAFPEARELGREMWGELRRGFAHAERALLEMETITQRKAPAGAWEACVFIPPDLEPSTSTARKRS